jgi:hypothetical protein
MVGLPGRKAASAADLPAPIKSRLLPTILDEKRLETLGTLNILDFGRANGASLEFFNQFSCRLCVLDAAETLLDWSEGLEARRDDPPSQNQMLLELGNLLRSIGDHRYDFVFLWDTLNHLHELALPAFARLLRRHVTADFRGHGFILHKRGTEHKLRFLGLTGIDQIAVHGVRDHPLHAHNRKTANEALAPDFALDQGVLHGDGRLEFLMLHGRGTSRRAAIL